MVAKVLVGRVPDGWLGFGEYRIGQSIDLRLQSVSMFG